jgi:energy-coupling factor transporter ATP-binding protein EcfA2
MTEKSNTTNARGSLWNRWDPHIHTPGTALNNGYSGSDPWDGFLSKIEQSIPPIRALGITDYCSIEKYQETIAKQREGRLRDVGLIFPNVEFRLTIETKKGSGVNLHFLFSPDDADHVLRIEHFLGGLEYKHQGEIFRCNRADLIRLGRVHKGATLEDEVAYRAGVNQFKIDFERLREAWGQSDWVQKNCLIAVSGGGTDGTSGLQTEDGQWATLRQNIESFAHIIFSATPQQIDFYLGKGAATVQDLEAKWKGRKPCLHGSDAHEEQRVGVPDKGRLCWISGNLTFEALRQVVIEPEGRVFIGSMPPRGAMPGNSIEAASFTDADWLRPDVVPINGGMVAIIGARGSGKTALADLIATGGFGVSKQLSGSSFLKRAAAFLQNSRVKLTWENGSETENAVASAEMEDLLDASHVQYLSQQFVERLCSSEGLNDELIAEIQRVIFEAHDDSDRMGTEDFTSLLALRLDQVQSDRERHRRTLERATNGITEEQLRKDSLPTLSKDRDEKQKLIDKDKNDRKLLIPKGQEQRTARLEALTLALEQKQQTVGAVKLQLQALSGIQADVRSFLENEVPNWIANLKEKRNHARLSEQDWKEFNLQFSGDVDRLLKEKINEANRKVTLLEGDIRRETEAEEIDPSLPLIPGDAVLIDQPINVLQRERDRLQKLVGIDEQNARRYRTLSDKISKAEAALAKVVGEIDRASKADDFLKALRTERNAAYQGVFDAVSNEQSELASLYAPLKERIEDGFGAVAKLSFSVRRLIDIAGWIAHGETLLDLRTGPFRGKGELGKAAELILGPAWRNGNSADVAEAMNQFMTLYAGKLKEHMPAGEKFRDWARKISSWLYSTSHIQVGYGLQYDGVEIESLSPGTRGVVLLLLYLAIDIGDDRPLIIDQPEENLDPQSVFDELVPVFKEAKKHRQIIIVTHNANLVVNTDVNQVIVARCGRHRPGKLPEITYESGGLEDPRIREAVCAILEGGERAFRERARRLRVSL